MRRKKIWALLAAVAMVTTLFATAASAENPWEPADSFVGQGMGGPDVIGGEAKIHRTSNGVTAFVSMPTPDLDDYEVPPHGNNPPTGWPFSSGDLGSPAAFSLWVFVFFNPEACTSSPCTVADMQRANEPPDPENPGDFQRVWAGGYNAGGHILSGSSPQLTISGQVNHTNATFGGTNSETIAQALEEGLEIEEAEVHLAIAPHGKLDETLMPEQISTPAGSPLMHWWVALFLNDDE